jgi:hypothetical protein
MRRLWLAGAIALAAVSLQAPAGHAACGVGKGWDLFTTGSGTYYNPVADVLGGALATPLTNVSFRGVPLGSYDFPGVGVRSTGATDTIVQRNGAVQFPGGRVPIELVALQLQANGIAGIQGDAPVYVTLQSQRGSGLLDPPSGAPSLGVLDIQVDPDCEGGTAQAQFTVHFDVRVLGVDGPIVLSRSLGLTTSARWTARPPTGAQRDVCHPHTIQTGVHCTLGPPVLIPEVNAGIAGGDFYLG